MDLKSGPPQSPARSHQPQSRWYTSPTHLTHEVGDAKDFAVGGGGVTVSTHPGVAGIHPRRALPPPAQHSNGGEPTGTRVVPKILVLPIETFVACFVQVLLKQTHKRRRGG